MTTYECIKQAISYLDSARCLSEDFNQGKQIRAIIELLETIKEK